MHLGEAGPGQLRLLRAYMAGAALPTLFLPFALAAYYAIRSGLEPMIGLERLVQFPLALAPLLWGIWNVVWAAQPEQKRLPLGVHGAVVPVVAAPLLVWGCGWLGVPLPEQAMAYIGPGVPLTMVLYFVLWRTVVGYLNRLLEVG
ncbi:MAG: hypothetical protein HZB13_06110 [Acidobacteria bacterium]|nr:hypothetical protein [Acidobacteriota bacterium]